MFNSLLITAAICYFHILFLWGLKNNKNLAAPCPQKKMTLTEQHFLVQIPSQLKMGSTAYEF